MQNRFRIAIVGLLVACVSATPKVPLKVGETQISFANLEANSVIKVHFESRGCFHHVLQHFRFTNNKMPLVQIVEEHEPPVTSYLLAQQLTQLDNLLAFYRANKRQGCTTVDTIDVVLIRNGEVVKREHYKDASCSLETFPSAYKNMKERNQVEKLISFQQIQPDGNRMVRPAKNGVKSETQARRK